MEHPSSASDEPDGVQSNRRNPNAMSLRLSVRSHKIPSGEEEAAPIKALYKEWKSRKNGKPGL
jgi:hypothetical protein